MTKNGPSWMVPLALLASACGGDAVGGDPTPSANAELDAYCAVAQRADLDVWIGDVLTLCASSGDDVVVCSGGRAAGTGAIAEIPLEAGLAPRRVLPARGGRLVALLGDERLVVLAPDGTVERELAAWAADPWVSEDGARVVWVGLPDGIDAWDFGVPTVIAGQSLDDAARTVLVDDESASTPRTIPGSRDLLFVSTSTGLASFWRVAPGGTPVQLTNVGLDEIGPTFVPVADRQVAWSDGALFFGTERDDGALRVWRLDLATREAIEVGPGAWPRVARDGSVLALQTGGAACAARYPAGGTP